MPVNSMFILTLGGKTDFVSIFNSFYLQATHDLENYDKTRHEEFKKYEMMKEHERREYLKTLDEEKRHQEEAKYDEMKKKHGDHPKVNHPVSPLFLSTLYKIYWFVYFYLCCLSNLYGRSSDTKSL